MSDRPVDPACECHSMDDTPTPAPSQELVPFTPATVPTTLPQRVEDLDPPYSAYPSISLRSTLYPENAPIGLGIRHVRPYAHFIFEKWHLWSAYDYYALYLDDLLNAVASDIVLDDLPRYDLFVPEEHVPEGEVSMYGRVLRAGTFQESTSPLQTRLIKTSRPGGTDRDPGSAWHTGLVMTVEGLPEGSSIDRLIAGAGVWCLIELYEHIRQNDRIELSWDGVIVTHIVSPAEAAGSGPIRIFVSEAIILQGGLLGTLTLRFRVQDVVENFSGEKYQYSKSYFLVSELDPSLLGAPIFLVDGEEFSQIDFDTQSNSIFDVLVLTPRQFPAPTPRHQIFVSLFATLVDGSTQLFPLPAATDNNLGFTTVSVDREIIEQLVGGSFRVSFIWQKANGDFLGQSGSVTITVIGTPVSMPGVTINPIELGLIDPDHDIDVTLPFYEPHNPDWLETLYIEQRVPGGGGETYVESQLAGPQGGSRHVSKEELQRFNGRGIIYFYYVVTDGKNTRKSVEVGAQVGERVAELPPPQLQGTEGNNINPAHIAGPTVLLTLPYLGAREGDVYHWSCIGSALGGSANDTILVNAATEGVALTFPVTRAILDFNLNGSLRISYSLERKGPPRQILRSEVLNLSVGVGVVLDRPEVAEAQRFPDRLDPLAALSGATVVVKFRPMHASDRIFIDWLSPDGHGSYATEVQGNPATHEVSVPIPREVIAKGIREDGNRISVQYHFFRGAIPYESDVLSLELLPLTGLPTPTLDGIGDSMVLQLSLLTDATRTRISVWNFIAANQRMWMTYEGTFDDGTPFIEHTYTANLVTETGVVNGISPPAPVDKLRRLKDGSRLTIRFWVSLSESFSKDQAVLFGVREHIVQAIPSTLPAPAFANLVAPTLSIYPLDYENTASVTVAYDGMNGTHRIHLQWIYPDSSMATIPAKDGLDGGRVDFAISQKILADSVGKTIELRYIAVINGDAVDSFVQTLTVQPLRESDLPRPLINGIAHNGTLDLNTFTGNATASLAKWRLSAQGQRVWLRCSSVGVDDLAVLDGVAITSAEAANGLVNKAVLRSWLAALPDNRQITVTCRVSFDGSAVEATAQEFPTSTYIVRSALGDLRLPVLLQASGSGASVTLAPLSALNGGTVRVSYTGMLTTDSIRVIMVGNGAAGSPVLPAKGGSTSGSVDFPIPASAIAANIGNSNRIFTLRYEVTRGSETKPSGTVTVTVTPIPAANLPRAVIHNIPTGGTLDLNTFAGNAWAALGRWPFIAGGQRVWIICSSAGVADLYVLNGVAITAAEAANGLANITVLRTWLESVPNNQQIQVKSQVTLNGSLSPGDVITLPTTTYTLVNYPPLSIDQTTMNLNGFAIIAFWGQPAGDYSGNNQTRVASGGRPPYSYSSRNPAVASVTAAGKVRGVVNGSTTIDVKDQGGHTVSYNVTVSNVYYLRQYASGVNYSQAIAWRDSLPGGRAMSFYGGIDEMVKAYGPVTTWPVPADGEYWLCLETDCNAANRALWRRAWNDVGCATQGTVRWAWCLQSS